MQGKQSEILIELRMPTKKAAKTSAPKSRKAEIKRKTKETDIFLSLNIDGTGKNEISTGLPFFDHMLDLLGKHSVSDLIVKAKGDLHIDDHHTVEDIGLALGEAIKNALGNKAGIKRYAHIILPMDEARAMVTLDLSGRPHFEWEAQLAKDDINGFSTVMVPEFFQAVVNKAEMTLHIQLQKGRNTHHCIEVIFKAFAKALDAATQIDPRLKGQIPSTKGML